MGAEFGSDNGDTALGVKLRPEDGPRASLCFLDFTGGGTAAIDMPIPGDDLFKALCLATPTWLGVVNGVGWRSSPVVVACCLCLRFRQKI